jgi:hypothetical protein
MEIVILQSYRKAVNRTLNASQIIARKHRFFYVVIFFKTMTEPNDYNNKQDDINDTLLPLYGMSLLSTRLVLSTSKIKRQPSFFPTCLNWSNFTARFGQHALLERHIRMSLPSFTKLLSYVNDDLTVNTAMANLSGDPITPDVCLYSTIRWLAGTSYSDVVYMVGISKASFFHIIHKTLTALNASSQLQIKFPATSDIVKQAAKGFE